MQIESLADRALVHLSRTGRARERNLSDRGRRDAARMEEAVRRRGVSIASVLVSPYRRTIDTGRLAFGVVTPWEPLVLIASVPEKTAKARAKAVEQRIREGAGPGNVITITHRPNIKELTRQSIRPTELVVVKPNEDGALEVIGRITLAEAP